MERIDPDRAKPDAETSLSYENQTADKVVDIAIARMKVGAVANEDRSQKLKKYALVAAIIAGFGLLLVFGSGQHQRPTTVISENGDVTVRLKQNERGHYFTRGEINGIAVMFLVDTGATTLAIPEHIANDLDLKAGRKSQSYTANGIASSYSTHLDTVSVGGITLGNIDASISPGLVGDEILLGMSFLKHLNLEQRDGVLTLSLN